MVSQARRPLAERVEDIGACNLLSFDSNVLNSIYNFFIITN